VLYNLPEGYGTMLGRMFDDASELSLGQWQKVALARAFARDAQVIILDEPTSVMDARAEYEFFVRFRELAKDKATLLISHRFSTVKIADRIYVMENGRIIESGSHVELLEREGKHAQLYSLQAQCYR
jgi:ATP-binding cassette subfamily B protein